MPNLPLMPLIGGAFAALCLVALPLWIMGIPGDPGDPDNPSPYVRGWTMGLNVLWVYPLAWALNFLPYFASRGLVSSRSRGALANHISQKRGRARPYSRQLFAWRGQFAF